MDVLIEASPMEASVEMVEPVVSVTVTPILFVLSPTPRLVSITPPTLGSHSISAVAPDAYFTRGHVALGVAA